MKCHKRKQEPENHWHYGSFILIWGHFEASEEKRMGEFGVFYLLGDT